jgi:hypothetical protein
MRPDVTDGESLSRYMTTAPGGYQVPPVTAIRAACTERSRGMRLRQNERHRVTPLPAAIRLEHDRSAQPRSVWVVQCSFNMWVGIVLICALALGTVVLFVPWREPFHRLVELLGLL